MAPPGNAPALDGNVPWAESTQVTSKKSDKAIEAMEPRLSELNNKSAKLKKPVEKRAGFIAQIT